MDRAKFHAVVAAAIDEIPEPFRSHLENVEVVVEDEPSPEILRDMGLFASLSLSSAPLLPDRIAIYYRPLVHDFRTPGAIRREIRKTIIHEVGHVFGLDDDEIEAEGY